MMRASDEEQLMRDELAERRRERDREREPRTWRRTSPDHRARHAFQARQVELMSSAVESGSAIIELECPACDGPVFAPTDSVDERIDCAECDARLVTARTEGGLLALLLGGAP